MASVPRRKNPVKWPLLALLGYTALSMAVGLLVRSDWLPFAPFGFLYLFLVSWADLWWLPLLLSLLPLVGWCLLHRGTRQGKWIINGVLALLLAADVLIFVLHFITSLSLKSSGYLHETVLYALACPVVAIPALILTNRWYPKI